MPRALLMCAVIGAALFAQVPTTSAPSASGAKAPETRPLLPKAGAVRIGITCDPAELTTSGVARITAVLADSPAAASGLKVGDVITAVNGSKITNDAVWRAAVAGKKEGDALAIEYTRDAKSEKADVKLTASIARKEPDVVTIQHCLIGFKGAGRSAATRTKDEAIKLAESIASRGKAGDDFGAMVKEHTEDPGSKANDPPGSYTLTNTGAAEVKGATSRGGMVVGFGSLAFALEIGEVAIVPYDVKLSPFGYHVMKRIK